MCEYLVMACFIKLQPLHSWKWVYGNPASFFFSLISKIKCNLLPHRSNLVSRGPTEDLWGSAGPFFGVSSPPPPPLPLTPTPHAQCTTVALLNLYKIISIQSRKPTAVESYIFIWTCLTCACMHSYCNLFLHTGVTGLQPQEIREHRLWSGYQLEHVSIWS